MPIEQVFEKAEDAPEFLRSALTEKNGKFVFLAELPAETQGLKSALESERKSRADAEKALKGYEGIDPKKAKELEAAAAAAAEEKAKAQGDWENWKSQMAKQFDQEKATLQAQTQELENALNKELVTAKAIAAIAAKEGEPTLLLPHIGAKTVVENGDRVVRILDERGNIRYGKSGAPMTIEERIAEMYDDPVFGRAFKAGKAGGSGSEPSRAVNGNSKTMTREAFDALDQAGRMKASKEGVKIIDI